MKLTGDMTEERQFLIQKALSWNGSAKISYPVLVVLSLWSLYSNLQNPGKMFADPVALMLNPLLLGICISWTVTYARLFRWNCGNTMAIKEGRPFPRMNLQRKVSFKKRIILLDEILILAVLALAFSSSMRALAGTMLSSILIVVISLFVRNLLRNNGSGNARDDWMSYAVGVGVLCMILIPLCNAAATHFLGADEPDTGRKHTVFASYQANDVQMSSSGKSVGVTVYTSPISWIIAKTSKCYPKDMTKWWNQMELELPAELGELPEGTEVSWCRYMVRKDGAEPVSEENFYQDEPTLDEVILKDRNRLVVLDYGGGMNLTDMKEAVDVFLSGANRVNANGAKEIIFMKKVFGIGNCMVGIVLVISGAVMKLKGQTAVTVIGGADGPTAVFVAGKLNGDFSIMLILIGIVLLAVAAIVYWKKNGGNS